MPPRNQAVQQKGPSLTAEALSRHILALLPPDGTPVLNRVMRVMLSRQLGTAIDTDLFFQARDFLLDRDEIGRLRGQGGQLFLAPRTLEESVKPMPPVTGGVWTEAQLMEPFGAYLSFGLQY